MDAATTNRISEQKSLGAWVVAALSKYSNPVMIHEGQPFTAHDMLGTLEELRAPFRILANQVVLLEGQNGPAFIIGLIALIQAGAIIAPISPSLSDSQRKQIARTLGATASLSISNEHGNYKLETFPEQTKVVLPNSLATGPGFIRFTSGTTGTARGVCISADAAQARAIAVSEALSLTDNDQVLFLMPLEQHFVAALLAFISAGVTIELPRESASSNLECNNDCSILFATPADIRDLSLNSDLKRSLPRLRLALVTTGAVSELDCSRFYAASGIELSRVFGAIEVGIALGNIHGRSVLPNSLGFPFPGYEVKICHGENEGRLAFRSAGLCAGYVSSEEQDLGAFNDGWFITADIAEQLGDHSFRIVGRAHSVINIAGYKVFPEDVEATILQMPEVKEARVLGLTEGHLGSVIAAQVVLLRPNALNADDVFQFCKDKLASYMVPKKIDFVSNLPKTSSGKIRRW